MRTLHSIDLKLIGDPCFGIMSKGKCRVLSVKSKYCGTYRCPFYKPKECRSWVRVQDKDGVNIVPPEEYERKIRRRHE